MILSRDGYNGDMECCIRADDPRDSTAPDGRGAVGRAAYVALHAGGDVLLGHHRRGVVRVESHFDAGRDEGHDLESIVQRVQMRDQQQGQR